MKIEGDTKLDYNDVLIRPKRTKLSSRSEVNLEREIYFPFPREDAPIVGLHCHCWFLQFSQEDSQHLTADNQH